MIWTKGALQSAKLQTFDCSRKISPNLYFDRLLLLKVYKILAKKVYTEELCLMTLKTDAKFEEKLTCGLKNDMRNVGDFHQSIQKCQNWDFDGILLSKVENV